jgi:hypothetical protein
MLSRLVQREGVCVLYTHLGKIHHPTQPFDASGIAAFHRLAEAYRRGDILVTTTRRVLRYLTNLERATWSTHRDGNVLTIEVHVADEGVAGSGPAELDGLSFDVPDAPEYQVVVNGVRAGNIQVHAGARRGWRCLGVPWQRLTFPDV